MTTFAATPTFFQVNLGVRDALTDLRSAECMQTELRRVSTLPTVRGSAPARGTRLSSRPSRPPYRECEIRRSWSSGETLGLCGAAPLDTS